MMGFTPQKTERNLNREYLLVCTHDDESSIKDRILKNFARRSPFRDNGFTQTFFLSAFKVPGAVILDQRHRPYSV